MTRDQPERPRIATRIGLAAALLVAALAFLVVNRHQPVLVVINLDPGALRPRSHVVLNPLRDRGLEHATIPYLERLRADGPIALLPILAGQTEEARKHILQREAEFPVRRWRIASSHAHPNGTVSLVYWVTRGNGYSGEEEVRFQCVRSDGVWRAQSFGAMY